MRRLTGLPLVMTAALADRESERLTLQLRNVPATAVLRHLQATMNLGFYARDGVIFVTSREDVVAKTSILKIYDVRSWLRSTTDFRPRPIGLRPSTQWRDSEEELEVVREGMNIDELVDLIRRATGASAWEHEEVSLRGFHGRLVVRHTPSMQRKVLSILAQL